MNRLPKLLLVAALFLAGVGVLLALVQPGSLGDEDTDAGTEMAQPDVTETESLDTDTQTDTDGTTSSITAGGSPATSSTASPATSAPSTTTEGTGITAGGVGGTGLDGGPGTAADTEDGLADTGGTSVVGPALLLSVAGLALRRRTD